MAVPAAGFLIPLFLLLLIQALSVSGAERTYESKVSGAGGAWASRPPRCGSILSPQDRICHCPLAPEGKAFPTHLLSGSSDHSATCWSPVVALHPDCTAVCQTAYIILHLPGNTLDHSKRRQSRAV